MYCYLIYTNQFTAIKALSLFHPSILYANIVHGHSTEWRKLCISGCAWCTIMLMYVVSNLAKLEISMRYIFFQYVCFCDLDSIATNGECLWHGAMEMNVCAGLWNWSPIKNSISHYVITVFRFSWQLGSFFTMMCYTQACWPRASKSKLTFGYKNLYVFSN